MTVKEARKIVYKFYDEQMPDCLKTRELYGRIERLKRERVSMKEKLPEKKAEAAKKRPESRPCNPRKDSGSESFVSIRDKLTDAKTLRGSRGSLLQQMNVKTGEGHPSGAGRAGEQQDERTISI